MLLYKNNFSLQSAFNVNVDFVSCDYISSIDCVDCVVSRWTCTLVSPVLTLYKGL